MKCLRNEGVEENLMEAIKMGFDAAKIGNTHNFFRIIEMRFIDMAHDELVENIVHNHTELRTQSKTMKKKLAEKVRKHHYLAERVSKITDFTTTKDFLVEDGSRTVVPKT